MKQKIKYVAFFFLTLGVFASCKKENATQQITHKSPVAKAGEDIVIWIPTDSVELIGSGTDEDGRIVSYSWSKVFGPATFEIANPQLAVTKVKKLIEGQYVFELIITDNDGLQAMDRLSVSVRSKCPCFPDPCDPWGDPCDPWDY